MNSQTLVALAEPNRLQIVELLRKNPRPVGEIAQLLGIRQPQASKHLRVLSDAGLVNVRPIAQLRIYSLRAQPFQELESWIDTFKVVWDARLDSLDEYLQDMHKMKEK